MPAAVILWQDCDPDPVGGECLSCKELFVTVCLDSLSKLLVMMLDGKMPSFKSADTIRKLSEVLLKEVKSAMDKLKEERV
jgi:hypothetical protein